MDRAIPEMSIQNILDVRDVPKIGSIWQHNMGEYYRVIGYTMKKKSGKISVSYESLANPSEIPLSKDLERWKIKYCQDE